MKAYFSLLIFVKLAVHLPLMASAYPVGRRTDLPFAQYPGEGEVYEFLEILFRLCGSTTATGMTMLAGPISPSRNTPGKAKRLEMLEGSISPSRNTPGKAKCTHFSSYYSDYEAWLNWPRQPDRECSQRIRGNTLRKP
ncbi:hypothetical protein B0H13DRAFT_1865833 [Mycena leptocephala]|nr:hypothetical protein B0H13DRAFT_1865833 [Mycena leptocephala]